MEEFQEETADYGNGTLDKNMSPGTGIYYQALGYCTRHLYQVQLNITPYGKHCYNLLHCIKGTLLHLLCIIYIIYSVYCIPLCITI